MTISKETIGERKTALLEDLTKVRAHGADLEKQKLENVALQNALTGAIQQCDDFLSRLGNDENLSDEVVQESDEG
tara:strand:- start:40 stop:264 length:225 start_codon:yes stop_codon:yes gene_type:complete